MKKFFLMLLITVCIVLISCFCWIRHAKNQIDYERPPHLSPEAIVILYMDSLNEMNLKKCQSFVSKEQRTENDTLIRDGKYEIKQIETICETENEVRLRVTFYRIERPYLNPNDKELRTWMFVLEKSDNNSEWMIAEYGEGMPEY